MLVPGFLATGQVKFTTVVSSRDIGKDEYLQVEFIVENASQIERLTPPDFDGFLIVQGPIQSSGMSVSNGNTTSQYKGLSFVLQPERTGKFTIGGAVAMVDGKKMQSNAVTVHVHPGGGNSGNGNAGRGRNGLNNLFPQLNWPDVPEPGSGDIEREYILKPGESIKDKIRRNLFVRLQVNKTTCYVGEPIVATYKLYSRLNSESRVSKRPSLNGFSVYDMIDPGTDASSVEKVNGKPFTVHIIRKAQLIPLQAGTVDLDPVEVENTVHFVRGRPEPRRSGNMLRDMLDQFDDNSAGPEIEENVVLDTKPQTITIKPVPEEGRPANYNGAVGNFSVQASLAGRNINAQDEATLKVVVKGSGNLPVVNAPQVQWPADVDVFEPKAKEDINRATLPMSGSKTFEYAFAPRTAGHYIIPAVDFSWFDPSTHSYKTASSGPLDFQVAAAAGKQNTPGGAVAASASSEGPATERLKKFIQQHLESIFAILILSILAVYLWRQNRRLRTADREKEENSRQADARNAAASNAAPMQQGSQESQGLQGSRHAADPFEKSRPLTVYPTADPLKDTRLLLENGDYKGFHRELNRTIWKTVTEKLDLPASELNKNNIARQLQAKGWDGETTRLLETILNECEMNLYMPAYDTYNMQQLLRQAETLFGVLIPHSSH